MRRFPHRSQSVFFGRVASPMISSVIPTARKVMPSVGDESVTIDLTMSTMAANTVTIALSQKIVRAFIRDTDYYKHTEVRRSITASALRFA